MNKKKYGVYEIIYADPPWSHDGVMTSGSKASNHYSTIPTERLKDLDVISQANKDCLLFMWAISPMLDEAIDLGVAWGFDYKTVGFVWVKSRTVPGRYTMSQCELCLIFKRKGGKIPQPRGARNIRQLVEHPTTKHSVKPNEVRTRIEEMFPAQRKIELFARQSASGWDSWGNEVDTDIVIGWN